jgi:hypothetical protein
MRAYQAIVTKYIGPSNTRGSRIKARAAAGSVTVPYNHALNIENNHAAATKALAAKLNWSGGWYIGGMPDDTGFVFVTTEPGDECAFVTSGDRAGPRS